MCRSCGHVVYIHDKVGQDNMGVPTVSDLRYRYQITVCPGCGREIVFRGLNPLSDIVITRRGEAGKITGLGHQLYRH